MTTKHTPGPLSVSFSTKWPFEILIINESGGVVYRESLPCHSSKDKNFEEALNCWNFKASEGKEYAAINHRAVADAYLRAAAPDLLDELLSILDWAVTERAPLRNQEIESIRKVIAKATGEQQ